jgi:hypothetical protein
VAWLIENKYVTNNWETENDVLRESLNLVMESNQNPEKYSQIKSYFDVQTMITESKFPQQVSAEISQLLNRWKKKNLYLVDSCRLLETRQLFESPFYTQAYTIVEKESSELSRRFVLSDLQSVLTMMRQSP